MRKTFFSVLITIVVVWLIHGMFLIKISKLEMAINTDRKTLEAIEKDLDKGFDYRKITVTGLEEI